MTYLKLKTLLNSTPEMAFDLSRDIDFHRESMCHTQEKAIAGKTTGLISLGESVIWEGIHFGIKLQHESKITAFQFPNYFTDEMVKGKFTTFVHEHYFEKIGTQTLMIDEIYYKVPFGFIGKIVDYFVLKNYLKKLLEHRNMILKTKIEKAVI